MVISSVRGDEGEIRLVKNLDWGSRKQKLQGEF